jgi:hypothetical protein
VTFYLVVVEISKCDFAHFWWASGVGHMLVKHVRGCYNKSIVLFICDGLQIILQLFYY